MRTLLLSVIVMSFLTGIVAFHRSFSQVLVPSPAALQIEQSGQMFVDYRNAVSTYLKSNPTFTGTVPSASLTAQGTIFPSYFLSVASNAVTTVGASGRVITCYAPLPPAALVAIQSATEVDASFGIASGTNWISVAYGAVATPLSTIVPNGSVVSVIQIGK